MPGRTLISFPARSSLLVPQDGVLFKPAPTKEPKVCWFFFSRKNILLSLAIAITSAAPASADTVTFTPPSRDFGIFPGDILRTEVVIAASPGETLDRASLPIPGALNDFIELRAISAKPQGTGISIKAEYQSFLATDHVMSSEIPGYTLRLVSGARVEKVDVPAWHFTASPLRVAERMNAALPELRPNHSQPLQAEAPFLWRIAAALSAAMLFAMVLAGRLGLLPRLRHARSPFAAAVGEISRLRQSDRAIPDSFRALHRAFDATAGRRLFAEDLPAFIAAHPRFAPFAAQAAAFFSASQAWFFGRAETPGWRHADVLALARGLRRLERRR